VCRLFVAIRASDAQGYGIEKSKLLYVNRLL
jgi:hypothetical protein